MSGRVPRISVVVPVYNAEALVAASVLSVLDHTLADIEVICVDDGSVDASAGVLEALAQLDARLRVIRLGHNQGECTARNTGLDAATGEFVFCLDADDTVPPGALDALLSAADSSGTALAMGRLLWLKSQDEAGTPVPEAGSAQVSLHQARESTFLQSVPNCHCCNLYSRQLLNDHGIRYAHDLTFGGDQLFQATAIVKAGAVAVIEDTVYVYHHYRSQSVTKAPPTLRNLVDDIEFHARIAELFFDSQMAGPAMKFLTYWSYAIREYWLQIPEALSREEASIFFSAFRSMANRFNATPWTDKTPEDHRQLLQWVMSGNDQEVIDQLATWAALAKPSTPLPEPGSALP